MSQMENLQNESKLYVRDNFRYDINGNSNFSLGENERDFNTKYKSDYYDKSNLIGKNNDGRDIENKMRKDQTVLGSDNPQLITEHAAEYTKKEIERDLKSQIIIPKGNIDLIGNDKLDWDTTYRVTHTPKEGEIDSRQMINVHKSNLKLGDGKFEGVTQYNKDYINHPMKFPNNLVHLQKKNKEVQFNIGEGGIEGQSVTSQDYKNPYNNPNYNPNNPQIIRKSNLSFGDNIGEYVSTYQRNMTPKKGVREYSLGNHKSELILGQSDIDFKTKYNIEYYDKSSIPQSNDLKEIQLKMRKDQTILGNDNPQLITEHAAEYTKKDIDRGNLKSQIIIPKEHVDLIGNDKLDWDTTHKLTYTPKKGEIDNQKIKIKQSNLKIGDGKFEGVTQYNKDYINHPILNQHNIQQFKKGDQFNIGEGGIEGQSVTSQDYKNPYNNPNYNPNNPQIIRKSNLSFGDNIGEYVSTYQRNMTPKKGVREYSLGNHKSELILGQSDIDFKTKYNIEYYDKSSIPQSNDLKEIQLKMRKDQTVLGGEERQFITEHAAEYTMKEADRNLKPQIKREHEGLIGYQDLDWNTTYRTTHTPKKGEEDQKLKINMQKSSVEIGKGKFEGQTQYTDDYIKYSSRYPINLAHLQSDRRRMNQFEIGEGGIEGESVTKKDYQNPYNNPNYKSQNINYISQRKSNLNLGDKNLEGEYQTTYQRHMTPKKSISTYVVNRNQRSSFDKNLPGEYITHYQENYIPKEFNNNIRGDFKIKKDSQFNFGNAKLDYKSVTMNDYKYNELKAREANNPIDNNNLLLKLKKGQYEINEGPFYDKTTYKEYHLPFNQLNQLEKEKQGKIFSKVGDNYNRGKFEGQTMYSTDFVQKPLSNVYHYCFY